MTQLIYSLKNFLFPRYATSKHPTSQRNLKPLSKCNISSLSPQIQEPPMCPPPSGSMSSTTCGVPTVPKCFIRHTSTHNRCCGSRLSRRNWRSRITPDSIGILPRLPLFSTFQLPIELQGHVFGKIHVQWSVWIEGDGKSLEHVLAIIPRRPRFCS